MTRSVRVPTCPPSSATSCSAGRAGFQEPGYLPCPTCNGRYELVFQIDSEQGVPWMWGDSGVAFILQCPKHPDSSLSSTGSASSQLGDRVLRRSRCRPRKA